VCQQGAAAPLAIRPPGRGQSPPPPKTRDQNPTNRPTSGRQVHKPMEQRASCAAVSRLSVGPQSTAAQPPTTIAAAWIIQFSKPVGSILLCHPRPRCHGITGELRNYETSVLRNHPGRISRAAFAPAIAALAFWSSSVLLLEEPPCKPSLQPAVRQSTDDIKADSGDETLDREAETFATNPNLQCFRASRP